MSNKKILTVALVQERNRGSSEANLDAIEKRVAEAAGADVVVTDLGELVEDAR